MNQLISVNRLVAGGPEGSDHDAEANIVQNNSSMPGMVSRQPERLLMFENLPEEVVNYLCKLSSNDNPAAEARLLRQISCISKAHQQFTEQRFRLNASLSLAGTHYSIPEIVRRSSDKEQINLLVQDLVQRHEHVVLNLSNIKDISFIDAIIKGALLSLQTVHLVIDMSVEEARKVNEGAQNFPGDSKRLESVIDAVLAFDAPLPGVKIELVLKERHLYPHLIKRLAIREMPSIHKLDISGVKLVGPNIPFKPELQRFFLPELMRYLKMLIKRGELVELSLSDTMLMPSHVETLASLLCEGKALAMLDLSNNTIGSKAKGIEKGSRAGVNAVVKLLGAAACPPILKLSSCGMDDAEATLLLNALPQSIKQLHLDGNPIAIDHPLRLDVRVKID